MAPGRLTVRLFRESLCMLADGLALELEEETRSVDLVLAEEAFEIAAGRIEPGTIAAQRFRWAGKAGGQERIVFEARYFETTAPFDSRIGRISERSELPTMATFSSASKAMTFTFFITAPAGGSWWRRRRTPHRPPSR